MIDTKSFLNGLEISGIQFVTGVPDSLLREVCACITDNFGPRQHITATNEGSAIGLAIGHHLATGRPALVYMQNSGLGNAVNPITSLVDPKVYGVPMILMIGWRGELQEDETQVHDEPQHVKQGSVTLAQLDILGIPYIVINAKTTAIETVLKKAVADAMARSGPVALVVRKNTFAQYAIEETIQNEHQLTREESIHQIISQLPAQTVIVSTTGMASRELFELRKQMGGKHQQDFLTVGGMGHASQIAMGIAISQRSDTVVCIDGDGAVLMHSGALAVSADCSNLLHIVLNNGAHDSVGGQITKGSVLRFDCIASAFGYKHVASTNTKEDLREKLAVMIDLKGSRLLEVCCKRGARKNLGRPDRSPQQNKLDIMNFLSLTK